MVDKSSLKELCFKIPKAELHVHLEGTIEPEMMLKLSKRNNIEIKSKTIEEIKEKYNFESLNDFLEIFKEGTSVIKTKEDIFDISYNYCKKCKEQNVIYTEITIDPSMAIQNEIPIKDYFEGIIEGMEKGKKDFGINYKLIYCIIRTQTEEEAFNDLKLSLNYKKYFNIIGLASAERNNPPDKFKNIFEYVKKEGFNITIHAGEDGPIDYIKQALKFCNRIDHGFVCYNDINVLKEISNKKIPLTLCPVSNLKLNVINDLKNYPIRNFLNNNVLVCINSDDPSYFGSYCTDNFCKLIDSIDLNKEEIILLAENSFKCSFLSDKEKENYLNMIEEFK